MLCAATLSLAAETLRVNQQLTQEMMCYAAAEELLSRSMISLVLESLGMWQTADLKLSIPFLELCHFSSLSFPTGGRSRHQGRSSI